MNFLQRRLLLVIAALSSVGMLCGCGSKATTPLVTTPAPAAIDGLWEMSSYVSSTTPLSGTITPHITFSGALHNNDGVVTGAGSVMYILGNGSQEQCFRPAAVTVTGSFDSSRHLTLTSNSVNNTVFSFSADIPDDLTPILLTGTISAVGTCAVPSSPSTAGFYNSFNGRYTGNVQNGMAGTSNATAGTVTMTLSETAPDPAGTSQITGTATLTFPGCSIDLPISQTRTGPYNQIQVYPATPPVVSVSGGHDDVAIFDAWYVGSDCKIQPAVLPLTESHWIGTITKQ